MELADSLGFAAVAVTLIAVPGPDWACILAAGARDRVVWPAVAGLMLGYSLITVVIAVGLGPITTKLPLLLIALTFAGAGYLAHLGVRTLRSTATIARAGGPERLAHTTRGYIGRGVAVSGFNPKGVLLFLSILPQFARASAPWPLPVQLGVLGMEFVLICGAFYVALGFCAHRVLGSRPALARLTSRIAGSAMILLGLGLIVERVLETAHG